MKTFVRACLFALPLLAACTVSKVQAWGPINVDAGVNAHWNTTFGGCNTFPKCLPWYSYFPYRAHFQTPSPMGGWPYWPAAASPPVAAPAGRPNVPTQFAPRGIQPVGYYGPAPSYWYGR